MTNICVSKLTIISSDNGLSPGRRQAIIWTNAGKLLFGPPGTNFSEILIGIHTNTFKKMYLKKSSGKWRTFCLGLNVLNKWQGFCAQINEFCTDGPADFYMYANHLMPLCIATPPTTANMGLLPNCGCACAGNAGNVFPATAGKQSRHASRHVRDARAVMHAGIANSWFPLNSAAGKTFPAFPAHAQPANLRIW